MLLPQELPLELLLLQLLLSPERRRRNSNTNAAAAKAAAGAASATAAASAAASAACLYYEVLGGRFEGAPPGESGTSAEKSIWRRRYVWQLSICFFI